MKIQLHDSVKREEGFTLVELAIVMVIIGVLIGGLLKGQELITNSQVTATAAQAKGIDAAVSTFRDIYDAFPGDMLTPGTRLPGCAGACAAAGNGNTTLANAPGNVTGENLTFWLHLSAADLISGIQGGAATFGAGLPSAKIRGGFAAGYQAAGALPGQVPGSAAIRGGHYVTLQGAPGSTAGTAISPSQAARIDRKMDDGSPTTGQVRAVGGATCGAGTTYIESTENQICDLHIRIQS